MGFKQENGLRLLGQGLNRATVQAVHTHQPVTIETAKEVVMLGFTSFLLLAFAVFLSMLLWGFWKSIRN